MSSETSDPVSPTTTADFVEILGKVFQIDHVYLDGPDKPPYYGSGFLPLRRCRDDLLGDIKRSQGPEWRR